MQCSRTRSCYLTGQSSGLARWPLLLAVSSPQLASRSLSLFCPVVSSTAVTMPKKRSKTSEQQQKASSKTKKSNASSKTKVSDSKKKAPANSSNTGTKLAKSSDKTVKWVKSEAKRCLKKQLLDPNSPFHKMSAKEVHASDPRYSTYPIKNFTTNLRNLKTKIATTKAQVEFDDKAVADHQQLFPRKSLTKRGYPHWNKHPAKKHLEDDVRDGTAKSLPPKELRMTRSSYQKFPAKIFCRRVQDEKRKQREAAFWVDKRNKKAMRRHIDEVAAMKQKNRL